MPEQTLAVDKSKRHPIDTTPLPTWGRGPDGRGGMLEGDARLPSLFRVWEDDRCTHESTVIIKRTDAANREFRSCYCRDCGTCLRTHLPLQLAKTATIDLTSDDMSEVSERYESDRKASLDRIVFASAERCQTENRAAYSDYLRSPEWRRRRDKIIERANGKCEGCLTNSASEVHHLSYDHLGAEFAFELVALCSPCHHRWHEGQNH